MTAAETLYWETMTKMDYEIRRDPRRNRVYFRAPKGLYVPGARRDGELSWFGVRDMTVGGLKALLDALLVRETANQQAAADYATIRAQIPQDYRKRHGSLYGGTVSIGGEAMENYAPALGTLRAAKWDQIGQYVTHGVGGLIEGRVQDRDTLYRAVLVDGRPVFREVTERGFGDDMRESYWFPLDLFAAVCHAEIKARGITPESATEWLAKYRGCVDSELYEFAVHSLPCDTPDAGLLARRSLPGGTGADR